MKQIISTIYNKLPIVLSLGTFLLTYFTTKSFILKKFKKYSQTLDLIFAITIIFYLLCIYSTPAKKPQYSYSQICKSQCQTCKYIKTQRTYHCKKCNQCYFRKDHHCKLINNCIAIGNLKNYILLLQSTFFYSCYIIYLNVYHIFHEFSKKKNPNFIKVSICICLSLTWIFVLWQVICLLKDQYLCIKLNQTTLQSYKNVRGKKIGFFKNFFSIFGKNPILWLIPGINNFNQINYLQKVYKMEQQDDKQYQKQFTDKLNLSIQKFKYK